jgi:hypothetical protein
MKVIFLDHDGVICLSSNWGGRYNKQKKWGGLKLSMSQFQVPLEYRFDNFDKKAISCLNEILEKSGAEIVVSSDWKNWANVEEMGEYYEQQGIIKKPIAFTPDLGQCTWYDEMNFTFLANWDREISRAIEIQQYLRNNPTITHWVAIDDLNMGKDEVWKDWALDNFVLTPRSNEGIKQSGIQEKILRFLDV